MANPGQTISKADLLQHVWDAHAGPDTDTVRVTVGTLRKKLVSGEEANIIDTVIGHGYCLREGPPERCRAGASGELRGHETDSFS